MPAAPLPPDEPARLAALRAFGILDTPAEADYDDLARLAAGICDVPIALVSLVDADRQWFKARVGIDACETHRDLAFCAHALHSPDLFEVPDAAADARFRDNPLVTGEPHIRFYAGMPLTAPDGHRLGTLCAIDRTPRTLTPAQRDTLRVLARQVAAHMQLRKQAAELRASEERFRGVVDGLAEGVVLLDRDTRAVLQTNPAFLDLVGYTAAEAAALTQYDFVAHDRADVDDKMGRIVSCGRASLGFRQYRRKDGRLVDVTVSGSRMTLAGRAVLCLVVQDVTDLKRAEAALRASEAKFRGTVDRLAEGLFVVDVATRRFVDANASVLALLGYTRAEFLALDVFDIVAAEDRATHARNVAAMDAGLGRDGRYDLGRKQLRRKDGGAVPVDLKVTVVPDGGAGLHAVVVRDVTAELRDEERLFGYQVELEAANARLTALAATDRLTGAKNRAAFDDRLADEHARARRTDRPLSLVLLDVDHFKLFNDTFGHPAGDAVLQAVAARLADTARGTDLVARYGGEEFAVVLPDTDYSGAMVLAERCRRAVAAAGWPHRPVTVSVGVATLAADGGPADLVREADQALYRSKQAGRNRVSHGSDSISMAALVRR